MLALLGLQKHPISSKLNSYGLQPTTKTTYNLPIPNYINDSGITLQKMYPMDDALTNAYAHHRVAYPGMTWECPVRAMGGSNPRFYEIVKAPIGVTLGEWLVPDGNGDYVVNRDYGLLTWPNPTAGNYLIIVRCTDMYGRYVTFKWSLNCSTANHMFIAPVSRGTGNGSTYANAIGEASVIFNGSTSPALNKVMVFTAGDYTSTNTMHLSTSTGSASAIGYPGETAIWRNKIALDSSDCTVGFMNIIGASTTDFGVIYSYTAVNRISSFYNRFESCINGDIATSNNQALHGLSAGVTWRDNVCIMNNTYIDCSKLHAFDFYNVNTLLSQCDEWIINNLPANANNSRSIWFPKARVKNYEISFNKFDNPTVSLPGTGVIQAYNGYDGTQGGILDYTGSIEYNFIRSYPNETAIQCNQAANFSAAAVNTATVNINIHRNTIINGNITARNWDYNYGINRRVTMLKNVYQPTGGANASVSSIGGVADSVWFNNIDTLFGNNVVDGNGKLTVGNNALRGLTGAQVYRV